MELKPCKRTAEPGERSLDTKIPQE